MGVSDPKGVESSVDVRPSEQRRTKFRRSGILVILLSVPTLAEQFESCLDAWLTGGARIVRQRRFARIASSSILEVRKGGDWKTVYRAFGDDWPHDAYVIQNSADNS